MHQEDSCIERDRDRPPSKLQSAMYYALDGDQVNILIMLAQKCEDFWVIIALYTREISLINISSEYSI